VPHNDRGLCVMAKPRPCVISSAEWALMARLRQGATIDLASLVTNLNNNKRLCARGWYTIWNHGHE
jgi:hypothetical protein